MEKDKVKAYTLVSIQMISILLILVTGWPMAGYIPLLIVQIAGVLLGVWGDAKATALVLTLVTRWIPRLSRPHTILTAA